MSTRPQTINRVSDTGPWDSSLDQLREWDPQWAAACLKMTMNPQIKAFFRRRRWR
jgi:hypothetical protein